MVKVSGLEYESNVDQVVSADEILTLLNKIEKELTPSIRPEGHDDSNFVKGDLKVILISKGDEDKSTRKELRVTSSCLKLFSPVLQNLIEGEERKWEEEKQLTVGKLENLQGKGHSWLGATLQIEVEDAGSFETLLKV